MKLSVPSYFKNKFVIATTIFFVFILFLDEYDIFTIVERKRKLHQLEQIKQETNEKLHETKQMLEKLNTSEGLEKFAREEKLFKKDGEDIFVIFKEN